MFNFLENKEIDKQPEATTTTSIEKLISKKKIRRVTKKRPKKTKKTKI